MTTKMGTWIVLAGQQSVTFYITWQFITDDK